MIKCSHFFFDISKVAFFCIADKPDPCGSGGSSNTAKVAKDFFAPENRKKAVTLWKVNTVFDI